LGLENVLVIVGGEPGGRTASQASGKIKFSQTGSAIKEVIFFFKDEMTKDRYEEVCEGNFKKFVK